ncbi:hypothetical protein BHYA_0166g00170 [Botrytis hyacinthi]|uniref:Uncharacterized protein n=1 Tax=Botrytis hyacinthi TaxID=278943 RepID=A0A4Z1GN07_9HELO|nr:hypothetical protein BHYA_0166g00170 [Botrytis hyacinthi]
MAQSAEHSQLGEPWSGGVASNTKQIMWINWKIMLKKTCEADGLDDSMKNDLSEDMSTVSEAFLDPDDFNCHFNLHF